jgi:polyphosphate glucokinase
VARSAANIHHSWIGTDAIRLFRGVLGDRPITVLNDADAAGLAEVRFGAAHNHGGSVLLFTFGTGIGSALISAGRLVPNTEFGHLRIGNVVAEHLAAASVRRNRGLTWQEWSVWVNRLLKLAETVTRPDLIVIGGGDSESERVAHWKGLLEAEAPIVVATLANQAGMVGAALHAQAMEHDRSQRVQRTDGHHHPA